MKKSQYRFGRALGEEDKAEFLAALEEMPFRAISVDVPRRNVEMLVELPAPHLISQGFAFQVRPLSGEVAYIETMRNTTSLSRATSEFLEVRVGVPIRYVLFYYKPLHSQEYGD